MAHAKISEHLLKLLREIRVYSAPRILSILLVLDLVNLFDKVVPLDVFDQMRKLPLIRLLINVCCVEILCPQAWVVGLHHFYVPNSIVYKLKNI